MVFFIFVKILLMTKSVQIIAFNIPYPPDYGGVIDIFYKIKSLYESGVLVYLHCFEYNRPPDIELEKYCKQVFYYRRNTGIINNLSTLPYIVKSRSNKKLLENISKTDIPIIFEGLHSCFYLKHELLTNNKKIVRTHNIEHLYYNGLHEVERNIIQKLFFKIESIRLKKFEKVLSSASKILCISANDYNWFEANYGNAELIPAFHPFNQIESISGKGEYVLFHGNLSVPENITAVEFLIENVIHKTDLKFIIAGKEPDFSLQKKIIKLKNVSLIANPEQQKMDELIKNSHVCLIPTFQDTGLKLKLLSSIFLGRFCVTNSLMVLNTGLEHVCIIADSANEMIKNLEHLFTIEFTIDEIKKRESAIASMFSNQKNAQIIIDLL